MGSMKLTPEKLTAFCAALAETGIVARACKAVDVSRYTAYKWRDEIPEFAEAWDRALRVGVTALEDEAHRRAFEGSDEPVFHQGSVCGSVRKYSDTLAIFLLKAHAPEKYRENSRVELAGSLNVNQMTEDEMRAELAALGAADLIVPTQPAQGAGDDCSDLV